MNEKNLPIKIFEKRKKVDERRVEGRRDPTLPDWAKLTDKQLEERLGEFKETLNAVTEKFNTRKKEWDFIPAVLELEMHELATAKSHRGDIAAIFNSNDETNFIGYVDEKSLLVKVKNENDLGQINRKLAQTEKNIKGIASIIEMKPFKPRISIEGVKDEPLKASLINFNDYRLNQSVSLLFENICRKNNVEFKKTNYSPELIIYRISKVSTDALNELKDFDALETISIMPKYFTTMDEVVPSDVSVPIRKPIPGKTYPVVGILDTGIKAIPHLKPWLLPDKFTKIPPSRIDPRHGTFVAGIVEYCDELEGYVHVGNEGCYLFDATVHPGDNDSIEEYELVENIREAIDKKHKEIKIWNLSLGTRVESHINNFSDFGKALDSIQESYGVLICKSVGNCTNFMSNKPVSRVAKSADSVRSLVIGSSAHKKGKHDKAEKNHCSPFSRVGKAPASINKPDLTQIGGNAGIDPIDGKLVISGVNSFSENGDVVQKVGTSFSTPRVTSLVAGLDNQLDEEFNPLLLKALAIHSAKYPLALNIPNSEKLKSLGYGIPSTIEDTLYNDPYEITLILQDTLVKSNWLEIDQFPFPQSMVENGFYYGEIIVTLVASPILNETQGAEYCQSNLEVRLGTYDKLKKRTGKGIINPLGLDEPQNLLYGGIYPDKLQKNHVGDFARERTLIKYGDKYQPVKKYAINLSEATPANKTNFLTAPKKWFLAVESFYRTQCIDQYANDGVELSQDFCLIVTIRDNKKKHRVYDLSTRLLNDNGFIHNDIKLRNRVSVTVRNR